MTLEQAIEHAAEYLPEDWSITLQVERGAGWVEVIRPDKSTVLMDDGEYDLVDQVANGCRLAHDEIAAERMSRQNA